MNSVIINNRMMAWNFVLIFKGINLIYCIERCEIIIFWQHAVDIIDCKGVLVL